MTVTDLEQQQQKKTEHKQVYEEDLILGLDIASPDIYKIYKWIDLMSS